MTESWRGSSGDARLACQGAPSLLLSRDRGAPLWQVAGFSEELRAAAGKRLQVGEIIGRGPGYFKLARGAQPAQPGHIRDAAGAPGAARAPPPGGLLAAGR
jgi:hypothetical protein